MDIFIILFFYFNSKQMGVPPPPPPPNKQTRISRFADEIHTPRIKFPVTDPWGLHIQEQTGLQRDNFVGLHVFKTTD